MNEEKTTLSQSLLTALSLTGLLAGIIAFRQFAWPQIEAKSSIRTVSRLTPPYIRLAESFSEMAFDQTILEVRANTAGIETIETDVVVRYDPKVLAINKEGIKFHDKYGVFQIHQAGEGTVNFSQFSNPKRHEPTFKTNITKEETIATLAFDILNEKIRATRLELKFAPGSLDESNLIPLLEQRPENPVDILQSTEGLTISL